LESTVKIAVVEHSAAVEEVILMSKTSSLILALAILSGISPVAYAQNYGGSTGPSNNGAEQVPWSSQMQPNGQQNQLPPPAVQYETWQKTPTLGETLDNEAQQQQQQRPPQQQGPGGWSQQSWQQSGQQQSQGLVPQGAINQSWGEPRTLSGMINDLRGMVKDMVNIDLSRSSSPNVKVRAPFVNVDVQDGHPNVNVNAPGVHVNKNDNEPVSVQAPFVNMSPPSQPTTP